MQASNNRCSTGSTWVPLHYWHCYWRGRRGSSFSASRTGNARAAESDGLWELGKWHCVLRGAKNAVSIVLCQVLEATSVILCSLRETSREVLEAYSEILCLSWETPTEYCHVHHTTYETSCPVLHGLPRGLILLFQCLNNITLEV